MPTEPQTHQKKTFAYNYLKGLQNSFHKSYKGIMTNYRAKKEIGDLIKIGILTFALFTFLGIFLYYVNLASTQGYFFKLSSEEFKSINEKSDIMKLKIIKQKRKNRDNLAISLDPNDKKNSETIQIEEEIIKQ